MPLPRKLSINDARIAGLYDLEHTIGKGHFAVVKLARHVFTGEKVAVKVIDKTKLDKTSQSHMMQEVRCMKLVQHPNIVRLYEVIDTSSKLFLILELGDYDMYDYIMKNEHKGIKEIDAQQYFNQIIKAIDYCHTLHVVHRDLKPENVVFFEKLGMVKLTDFGFSNLFEPGQQLQTSCGSLAYSAPEILLGDSYDAPAVDVWSLGVILYMLVCGRLPFQETNESETLTKILDCRFSVPEHVSQSCKQLIGRMLVREPSKRATLTEIVESPWVQAGDRGLSEHLPLIMKDQLPISAHTTIVEQMVAGNIATEEEILNSIDNDDYTYITATYYLLAERVLACYREEQALRLLAISSKDGEDLTTPTTSAEAESGGTSTSGGGQRTRSRSNSFRGTRRACTILKEESEEELCSYLRSPSRQSSRFFTKDSFAPPPLRREISQVSSSSRHSFVTSRTSSCENFASLKEEEEDPTIALVADAVAKLECELEPSETRKTSLFGPFPNVYFDELSPIRELGEHTFGDTVQFQLDSGSDIERPDTLLNLKRRKKPMHSSVSLEIPDSDTKNPPSKKRSDKLPRTPSAPNSVYSTLAKKRFLRNVTGPPPLLRRNSSPSVSMFGTSGLHSSRDRISPHAISELLDFSRLSSMRRAASPDSRISSRSPSPNSSGRTSPAITANFLRLKSTNPSTSSGMRKLSSSPHLLGICEEAEETIEPLKIPFHSTPRSISTISQKGPHLSRGNRSASIGLSNVTFSLKPSFTKEDSSTSAPTTYSSVRVIRPRQAVVSPDMARRYDQHPRLLSRNRRSTSCSSENSETSDDDVNERKLSLIGSKYCKRNSDDKNNDDDAPKGGGGGGGSSNGPHRSNSMKEQTIPEEPSNTNEKEKSEKEQSNTKKASKGSFFLDASPSSSSCSFVSDSECFSRQLSTPLQPIMEDNNFYVFNKSQATEDALYDWLQESKTCWENMEEIEEAFKECNKHEKINFYRLLRRSKSLESIKATDSGISYTGNTNTVIVVNEESEEKPLPLTEESVETTATDSGCSSDNEEKPSFNPKHVENNFNNNPLMKPIIITN